MHDPQWIPDHINLQDAGPAASVWLQSALETKTTEDVHEHTHDAKSQAGLGSPGFTSVLAG